MSFDIRYHAGSDSFELPLTQQDVDWLKAIERAGIKGSDELFEVDGFEVETFIGRDTLMVALKTLLEAMANGKLRPFAYYFDWLRGGILERGLSNTSGIWMDPDHSVVYALDCGVERCTLERYRQRPEGGWQVEEKIDIRSQRVIPVENGEIRIYQKPLRSALPKYLKALVAFLEEHADVGRIGKTIY